MGIGKRLKQYIVIENTSQLAFSKQIETTPQNVSSILKEKSNLTLELLEKISVLYPDLNLRWLLTGIGEMLASNQILIDSYNMARSDNAQDPQITTYTCPDCIVKQKEIRRLEKEINNPTSPEIEKRIAELEDDKARLKEYNDFLKQKLGERGDWPGKDVEGGVENPAKTG